ncbi:hypothetical protein PybrP1_000510 [[Pythium] brassicae (nom. inval.)]|nr:hypothetical protein PybrP1_000510 [[Pythium] brassicae (nom. inval.)]
MRALKKLYTADELTFGPPSLSSASSSRSTFLTSCGGDDALEDWVYWQRDAHNSTCWTKVFAVLENEFLWLFKSEKRAKSLFMQIAVATVEASGDRQLRLVDPNGEDLELWLRDSESFELWHARLHEASATTAAYFRAHALEVEQLPKSSAYRGSLVAYRRVGTRDRCRALLARLVGNWRLKRSRRALPAGPYSIS